MEHKLLKSRLHELSCSQISRQVPFKKNTAAKVQAQPIVSNAAKSQALLKDKELPKTASADPDKSKKLNFVVPQENLSHLYIVKCSACHGKDGNGPVGPSIAGNPTNTI